MIAFKFAHKIIFLYTFSSITEILDIGPSSSEKGSKKTWKGKVAKQWKKMQGTSGVTLSAYPEGGSIGEI